MPKPKPKTKKYTPKGLELKLETKGELKRNQIKRDFDSSMKSLRPLEYKTGSAKDLKNKSKVYSASKLVKKIKR